MNRLTRITLQATLALTLAAPVAAAEPAPVAAVPAQPKFNKANAQAYGKQLAEYMDRYDQGWRDQYGKSRMTLFDAKGDSVAREVLQSILEGADGDKSVVRFMKPADVRGVATLIHEHPKGTDDTWLYLPANRRKRRISGSNRTASFQGTEFTYEDLSSLIISKYAWKLLGEDELRGVGDVYKLEAKPQYKNTGYQRLTIYLNPKHWRIERIDYYDKAGRLLKSLKNSKWKHFHGRFWRATRVDMRNLQTKKRTLLELKSLLLDVGRYKKKDGSSRPGLDASRFTKRALSSR